MNDTLRIRPRGIPWWFWGIVLFQSRVWLSAALGFITHDPGRLLLSGSSGVSGWISVAAGLPALLMAVLYALEVTSGGLRYAALNLMVLASLADIAVQLGGLVSPELSVGERYWPCLMVLSDAVCLPALMVRGRLRSALLSGRD